MDASFWRYRVAEIEWVKDIYPSEGTRERADEQSLANVSNMMQMKTKHRCGSKSIPVRIYSSIGDLIWTCLVIWRAEASFFCIFVHITLHVFWLRCKFYIFVGITRYVW
ncbi:hypothetical protein ACSBR2_007174 [Camellia fascicularis]